MKHYNYTKADIKAVHNHYPYCGVVILDILTDNNNILIAYCYHGILYDVRENKLYTTKAGKSYFRVGKNRYYLEDFNILL